jgi:hypothetical protein
MDGEYRESTYKTWCAARNRDSSRCGWLQGLQGLDQLTLAKYLLQLHPIARGDAPLGLICFDVEQRLNIPGIET